MILEICELEKNSLEFITGAKFDKKYPLVNLADGMAYYIVKNYSLERIAHDSHFRQLRI